MTTKLLLHLSEPDGVAPSDAIGNLADLVAEVGLAEPAVVPTWTGRGRAFTASTGLVAADAPTGDTVLLRDVTIQTIIAPTASAGLRTVIARGLGGSLSERVSYGLRFGESAVAGLLEVQLFHETPAGVEHALPAGVFQHAGDGKYILLTATRRWESSTRVVGRYYVGDEMIAEVESEHGEIGGATTGTTSLGVQRVASAWARHFVGTIDEIMVTDHEMSPEEVREVWRRLTVHQPAGEAMFAGLAPPGAPWLRNPGNKIGRRAKVAGQALGRVIADTEEMRALSLPDAMTLELAPRWERLTGQVARPRDSLDQRRARVLAFLSREEGSSRPAVAATLAELLDQEPADVTVLEFTNEITDAFTSLAAERWLSEPPSAWAAVAGQLRVTVAAASNIVPDPLGIHVRTPLDTGEGQIFVSGKVAVATLPVTAAVGLLLTNRRSTDSLWFGVYNNGGTLELAYQRRVGGVYALTVTGLVVTAPIWLRAYSSEASPAAFTLAYSTTGPDAGFAVVNTQSGIADMEWAGFGVFGAATSTAGPLQVDLDDFRVFTPEGDRPFYWYVFRDPGVLGEPDILGADALLDKIAQGHTYAAVIENRSVLCDDPRDGLCDHGPLGGL